MIRIRVLTDCWAVAWISHQPSDGPGSFNAKAIRRLEKAKEKDTLQSIRRRRPRAGGDSADYPDLEKGKERDTRRAFGHKSRGSGLTVCEKQGLAFGLTGLLRQNSQEGGVIYTDSFDRDARPRERVHDAA